jgi:hypothetical protein
MFGIVLYLHDLVVLWLMVARNNNLLSLTKTCTVSRLIGTSLEYNIISNNIMPVPT